MEKVKFICIGWGNICWVILLILFFFGTGSYCTEIKIFEPTHVFVSDLKSFSENGVVEVRRFDDRSFFVAGSSYIVTRMYACEECYFQYTKKDPDCFPSLYLQYSYGIEKLENGISWEYTSWEYDNEFSMCRNRTFHCISLLLHVAYNFKYNEGFGHGYAKYVSISFDDIIMTNSSSPEQPPKHFQPPTANLTILFHEQVFLSDSAEKSDGKSFRLKSRFSEPGYLITSISSESADRSVSQQYVLFSTMGCLSVWNIGCGTPNDLENLIYFKTVTEDLRNGEIVINHFAELVSTPDSDSMNSNKRKTDSKNGEDYHWDPYYEDWDEISSEVTIAVRSKRKTQFGMGPVYYDFVVSTPSKYEYCGEHSSFVLGLEGSYQIGVTPNLPIFGQWQEEIQRRVSGVVLTYFDGSKEIEVKRKSYSWENFDNPLGRITFDIRKEEMKRILGKSGTVDLHLTLVQIYNDTSSGYFVLETHLYPTVMDTYYPSYWYVGIIVSSIMLCICCVLAVITSVVIIVLVLTGFATDGEGEDPLFFICVKSWKNLLTRKKVLEVSRALFSDDDLVDVVYNTMNEMEENESQYSDNRYGFFVGQSAGNVELPGCINDAIEMRKGFRRFGYRTQRCSKCSAGKVMKQFRTFLRKISNVINRELYYFSDKTTKIVFYFSGHSGLNDRGVPLLQCGPNNIDLTDVTLTDLIDIVKKSLKISNKTHVIFIIDGCRSRDEDREIADDDLDFGEGERFISYIFGCQSGGISLAGREDELSDFTEKFISLMKKGKTIQRTVDEVGDELKRSGQNPTYRRRSTTDLDGAFF